MKDVNRVFLLGRLGADPIQRETKNGFPVVHFSLATSKRFKDENAKEGEVGLKEETQWHRVVVWGRQGEVCARYLKKGNAVCVEGSLKYHSYQGKDLVERTAFEVHAENVSFLNGYQKGSLSESVAAQA